MFFNKWKKRAYAERAITAELEAEMQILKEGIKNLSELINVVSKNPILKQIAELRGEAQKANIKPTKVYLTAEQQYDLFASAPISIVGCFGANGFDIVYGLKIVTTSKNMRVE
jgi:hypothetical protein